MVCQTKQGDPASVVIKLNCMHDLVSKRQWVCDLCAFMKESKGDSDVGQL